MEAIWQDLRLGLRVLAKRPGFTVVAVVTLALGIGANTAIFSVLYSVLLRPLPFAEADRLVKVEEERPAMGGGRGPMSFLTNDTLKAWRDSSDTLEQIAGYNTRAFTLTGNGEPARVSGSNVSAALFPLLRVVPEQGRLFEEDEERPGQARVALLSNLSWHQRFAGDPEIVGKPLILDGNPHTVVGVLPAGFHFPNPETEIWTPLQLELPARHPGQVMIIAFEGIGRLAEGVSIEQAAAEGQSVVLGLAESRSGPAANLPTPTIRLTPLLDRMVGELRPAVLALMVGVGFVLLIACANLANLMLARSAARRREMAMRAALGAGRGQLVRQLLVESLVLSLAGGAAGLLLAVWIHRLLPLLAPRDIPRLEQIGLDPAVLGFTALISLATGVLFGLVPALQSSRVDLVSALTESGESSAGSSSRLWGPNRTRTLLAVAEIGMAVILLVAAGLLLRSFMTLVDVDPGYDPRNVLTAALELPHSKYRDEIAGESFYAALLDRLEAAPMVRAAGVVSFLPLTASEARIAMGIEGRPQSSNPEEWTIARPQTVSAGYFDAAGLRRVAGRALSAQDDERATRVAVVNETFSRRYFPDEETLGQRLVLGPESSFEIVGIVADTRHSGLDAEPMPEVYTSYMQPGAGRSAFRMHLAIRTEGDPLLVVPLLRQAIAELDPELPLDRVETLQSKLSTSVAQPRFYATLLGAFAVFAVGLAAVGIYGLLSYSVIERNREIGVRRALGAHPRSILALVLRQGLALTLAGLLIGLFGAFVCSRFLASLLFGVEPGDPTTYVVVPLILGSVALVACYIPARRATRVDPIQVLRYE